MCITIERANENINRILFQNGYIFVKNYKYDTFYIHNSIKDMIKCEIDDFSKVPNKIASFITSLLQ